MQNANSKTNFYAHGICVTATLFLVDGIFFNLHNVYVLEIIIHCLFLVLGNSETLSLGEIKKPTIYRPLILSVSLMLFQQLGGVNAVLTYAATILRETGFNDGPAISIVIAAVQFVATGIACLIVDKLGRRKLLIFPGILMSMSMVLLGFSKYFIRFPDSVVLLSLSLFIIGFALGWGPIPWLVMSEIFPLHVRGIASGIATQVNWLGNFLVVYTYSDLKSALTPAGAFWFYGVICLLSAIFVFFFLPETKGRTLEEVEGLFKDRPSLRSLLS